MNSTIMKTASLSALLLVGMMAFQGCSTEPTSPSQTVQELESLEVKPGIQVSYAGQEQAMRVGCNRARLQGLDLDSPPTRAEFQYTDGSGSFVGLISAGADPLSYIQNTTGQNIVWVHVLSDANQVPYPQGTFARFRAGDDLIGTLP